MIDDHGYDGNHLNGIIDLTDKGIGVSKTVVPIMRLMGLMVRLKHRLTKNKAKSKANI